MYSNLGFDFYFCGVVVRSTGFYLSDCKNKGATMPRYDFCNFVVARFALWALCQNGVNDGESGQVASLNEFGGNVRRLPYVRQ